MTGDDKRLKSKGSSFFSNEGNKIRKESHDSIKYNTLMSNKYCKVILEQNGASEIAIDSYSDDKMVPIFKLM